MPFRAKSIFIFYWFYWKFLSKDFVERFILLVVLFDKEMKSSRPWLSQAIFSENIIYLFFAFQRKCELQINLESLQVTCSCDKVYSASCFTEKNCEKLLNQIFWKHQSKSHSESKFTITISIRNVLTVILQSFSNLFKSTVKQVWERWKIQSKSFWEEWWNFFCTGIWYF